MLSCTSTRITSSWTAPNAGSHDYKKILVVSVIQNEDSTMRQEMESHFVDDLKDLGYEAVSYRATFKESEFRNMRYDDVRTKLSAYGIDGVITISLMATEKESTYVKDKEILKEDYIPLGASWNSQASAKQQMAAPGFYVTSKSYYWESNFYDVAAIALLYSAHSEAFEVTSTKSLAHKYGKMILADLQKNYLLGKK